MTQPLAPKGRGLIVLLAALVAFAPLSIDMYLPSLPTLAGELGASERQVQHSISVFLVGLCLGMLFYGPLSDRYGRRPLLLGGILLYVVASLGCALVRSADQLLLWRGLQALGGAAASVLARTIVRDLFPLQQSARVLSLMHLVTMLATLVAPLLGSWLMQLAGWRSIFVGLLGFAALCALAVWCWVPETHRGEARGHSLASAFAAYLSILRQPRAVGLMLCMELSFAGMFAYITASPFVFIERFGFSPSQYALLFGANIAGVIVATFLNARLVGPLGPEIMLRRGSVVSALAGLWLLLAATQPALGWWGVALGLLLYVSVTGMLGANAIASLMALFPQRAGAAAALAVAGQFGLGALASGAVGLLHDGSAWPMCLVVALCGLGAFLSLRLAVRREAVVA
ncbi:Bcr/CflA family multidrug efflux MFS transporter [Metapseudomonas furukawaii]|uniref:Bcr/CflA family efflux transporter n=1 Tax=Metapseudomonas furukawaii TaxID=1149133 RepID=A0AAD1C138_METFU|nr:Bcr/CflA family multidrug efflux MFS transporter [Pseudomonas furukawaii]ELS25058.1 Multidrug resistance transporter, Bcr/CflA family [Pseudomonas furukawaii]BAU74885.1 multidrug resistance transporter [Pseudomonas furukawaii]